MNNTASPTKPLLSIAFPAAASMIQDRLPLMADPCSRLLWDDSSDGILTFVAASQADYDLLSAGTNWARINECFPAGSNTRLIFDPNPVDDAERPQPTSTRKPTKLNTRQLFQLLHWMRENEPDVKNLPDAKLAQMAGAALDFPITPANFTHARESAGIEKTVPNKPKTVEERVELLEKTNADLLTILGAISKVILENWRLGHLFQPNETKETLESTANAFGSLAATVPAATSSTQEPTLL